MSQAAQQALNAPAQMLDLRNQSAAQNFFGQGTAGQRLMASGWDVNSLRPCAANENDFSANGAADFSTNATLRRDEWVWFDQATTQIARERLVVTDALLGMGLSMPLPNALGVLSIEWDKVGDLEPAELSMSGLNEASKDALDYSTAGMPIPLIHKEFTLNLRQLEAARRNGRQMDRTHAEVASRKVAELIEQIIFTGATIASTHGTIYGLLNHPNRTTGSIGTSWLTETGENIIGDLLTMIGAAEAKNMFGPYILFVPTGVGTQFSRDYKANSSDTIWTRIRQVPNIRAIIPTNRLTGANVLLVQATSDVIQVIDGLRPTIVQWDSRGGFELNFKIFAIMLPRVRADYANQSGIVHYS